MIHQPYSGTNPHRVKRGRNSWTDSSTFTFINTFSFRFQLHFCFLHFLVVETNYCTDDSVRSHSSPRILNLCVWCKKGACLGRNSRPLTPACEQSSHWTGKDTTKSWNLLQEAPSCLQGVISTLKENTQAVTGSPWIAQHHWKQNTMLYTSHTKTCTYMNNMHN